MGDYAVQYHEKGEWHTWAQADDFGDALGCAKLNRQRLGLSWRVIRNAMPERTLWQSEPDTETTDELLGEAVDLLRDVAKREDDDERADRLVAVSNLIVNLRPTRNLEHYRISTDAVRRALEVPADEDEEGIDE